MSAERPIYENREFYGPLELSKTAPEMRYRYMLEHPDDPTKLIRTTEEGEYADRGEMDHEVAKSIATLEGLEEHGITHTHPVYSAETGAKGRPYLVMTVDKIADATPYSTLIENNILTDNQLHEADRALCGMLDYVHDVMSNGGPYDSEMMRLEKFVYTSDTNGSLVLTGIEPFASDVYDPDSDPNEESIALDYPSGLAICVINLTIDTVTLSTKTDDSLESLQKAADAVTRLPGSSDATNKLKSDLLTAITTRTLTPELMHYVNEEF
jgi:hypothetical protein